MHKIIDYLKNNYNFYILLGLTIAFHFVSSEAFLIGVLVLATFYLSLDMFVNKHCPLNKKYIIIIPLIFYILLGLAFGLTNKDYTTHNIIRDLFYHTNTLAVIILTLTIFTDKITKEQVFWSFLIVGSIIGLYTLFRIKAYLDAGNEINYTALRILSNAGYLINFISVLSFLFIKKYKYVTIPLSIFNLIMAIVSFSRVGIILLICMLIFIAIYYFIFSNHKISFLVVLLAFCSIIIVLYFRTTFVKDTLDRFSNTINELNPNKEWSDVNNIYGSWRGYEVHLILEQFKVDNLLNKLLGHGFGSFIYSETPIMVTTTVNGETIYESINEIPLFHNGYFGTLFKCGIVGLLLYISFLIILYVYSFKYIKNKKDLFLNLSLITYIVLATYVVMGLFHSEVWFPLIFLVIYLIKYHYDKREEPLLAE